VGNIVVWAEAGVGVVATQSIVNGRYGPLGLAMLRNRLNPKEVIEAMTSIDAAREYRQVAVINTIGETHAYTGSKCIPFAGHRIGKGFSVQANLVEGQEVIDSMYEAFESNEGNLADRLMTALENAEKAGGDIRGSQSAALIVVKINATGDPLIDKVIDIRVDDNPNPIYELKRLLRIQKAYNKANEAEQLLSRGLKDEALETYEHACSLAPEASELRFWKAITLFNCGEKEEAKALLRKEIKENARYGKLLKRLINSRFLETLDELEKILEES